MTKGNPEGIINRHKAMAMGEKVKTMKHGGAVKKAKGGCMKKGGTSKKK
jgi:hypothetical protein